jgi:carbohydrate kinase (thermoresistant glucokinase family)
MGVSGSGKSTIGSALAQRLGLEFLDGDDLHSVENRTKMASGIPLQNDDRVPWLERVGEALRSDAAGVVACSALTRSYRDVIRSVVPEAFFVHLAGSRGILERRLAGRIHEFMPATLLASQIDILEPLGTDERGVTVRVTAAPDSVVDQVLVALGVG